jgi:uncharacterized surface protein with fasciclin (FAS1) repeats
MKLVRNLFGSLAVVALLTSCQEAAVEPTAQTVAEAADQLPNLHTSSSAVSASRLRKRLHDGEPVTYLAPNEEAWRSLPSDVREYLWSNHSALREVMRRHIVVGEFRSGDLRDGDELQTVGGSTLDVEVTENGIRIQGADVVQADIKARNGVIHVINKIFYWDPDLDNIVETAAKADGFETLVAAVEAAGLTQALATGGPFTVFAPTDEAFAALPEGTVEALLADPDALAEILKYHVVKGRIFARDLKDGLEVKTLQGSRIVFALSDEETRVNDSDIIATDIKASNGVIHVIDAVLLPPEPVNIVETAAAEKWLSTLVAAVEAAGLTDALANGGPFTVFAPTNRAFDHLPEGALEALLADPAALADILKLHVVEGTILAKDLSDGAQVTSLAGLPLTFDLNDYRAKVNGAEIIETDLIASNGVIHIIDEVLLPPPNIIGALEKWRFHKLLAAIEAAGLTDVLANGGPFTLFAPTNHAFARLPEGVLDALLADPDALAGILKYHVVEGIVASTDLANGEELTTLTGEKIRVNVTRWGIKLNGVDVEYADKRALNGIVHVIDEVLIPPKNIAETAAANEWLSTLVAAVEAAGLTDALANGGPFTLFAPTNQAFARVPKGTLEALLADPAALAEVLKYHVVPGAITSYDLEDGVEVATLQGEKLRISLERHWIGVNYAEVIDKDIFATNGI